MECQVNGLSCDLLPRICLKETESQIWKPSHLRINGFDYVLIQHMNWVQMIMDARELDLIFHV